MKLMFLVFHALSAHSGISKKILAQIEGLKENELEVNLCSLEIAPDGRKCRKLGEECICDLGYGLKAKIRKRTDYSDIVCSVLEDGYDAVYIRYDINADPFTVRMVRELHKYGIKTIVEIPTYPYDEEFRGQGLTMNLQLLTDKVYRKRFFSFCDAVVLYNGPEKLYGRPAIHISNGVDFNAVPLSHPGPCASGSLRLLSVANIHLWHGLDRLIRGMAEHKDVECELHIVGDGLPEIIESYRRLADENGIGDKVKILGPMYGDALNREFEWADMAVGSLGRHRSGITGIKTLKNREYAARGLCFFYSEQDEDFDSAAYVLKVPADESAIDIKALKDFLSSVNMNGRDIRKSVEGLSWKKQMAKVIEEAF